MITWATAAAAEVELRVADADDALEQNLRARLTLLNEPCDAPGWRVRRLFRRVEADLEPALRAFGYYRATVDKRLRRDADCWHASIEVRPGERVIIRQRSVEVRGAAQSDAAWQALLAELPLAVGEPLHHGRYEEIKTRLRDLAAQRGYLDFAFTDQQLRVDPARGAAEIRIEADSGPRYRFGELRFSEQPLDEEFLTRLGGTRPGEPYDTRRLTAIDRQLSDSGYFQRVEVRARRDQRVDHAVPVEVTLEPAKQHAWRLGLGYATDTGPRASVRYDNRYLNRRGHRWENALRLSPVESGLTSDYVIPGRDPQRESYSLGVGYLHEETDTTDSHSVRAIARQTRKTDGWTRTHFIELLHERSTVGEESTTETLTMPGISLDRVRADDLLRTRRGYRLSLEGRAAYQGLLSTATLLQLRAAAKGIYRFGDAGRVTLRADLGATLGDSIDDLPASLRFFAGGDNSVRGYAYKSLGPLDDNDEPAGGRHLIVGSVEYEHPVVADDWWVATFVDAGNAFDDDRFTLRSGYGLGVRWYSPIGRVRLDLAFPDDTADDQWRIHFGLGADL